MEFVMSLAGVSIAVQCSDPETKHFCKDYLTDAAPELTVAIAPEDIAFEREKSASEDTAAGRPVRRFSDRYLETLALYRKIAEKLPAFGILLFHGSCIAVDGEGYLFTAKSGTGKSTHTRLWCELFGPRACIVNDDKPLLIVKDDGVWVCGTPWDGKHRLSTNTIVPLKGICALNRGTNNEITRLSPREALPVLLQQTYRPAAPENLGNSLRLVTKLSEKIGFYRLYCNMDPSAAQVAYDGMNRKEESL